MDERVLAVFQAQDAEELVGAGADFGALQFIDCSSEFEVLFNGERVKEREAFGKDASDAFQFRVADLNPADLGGAAGGAEQTSKDFDDGGFTRAIGAKQGADGAGSYVEGGSGNSAEVSKGFGEPLA